MGKYEIFFRRPLEQLSCSCGESVADCAAWAPYSIEDTSPSLVSKLATNHRTVIDSSKTTFGSWRHFFRLTRSENIELIPIIAFSHPARVHFSRNQGDNRLRRIGIKKPKRLHSIRMYVGWLSAYIFATGVCFVSSVKPIYVNFDDFSSIEGVVSQLKELHSFALTEGGSRGSQTFHIIEGNRHASDGLKSYVLPLDIKKYLYVVSR